MFSNKTDTAAATAAAHTCWDITYIHLLQQSVPIYNEVGYKEIITGSISLCCPNWHIDIELPVEKIMDEPTQIIYNIYHRQDRFVPVYLEENETIHSFLFQNNLPPLLNYTLATPNINYNLQKEDTTVIEKMFSVILGETPFKTSALGSAFKYVISIKSH
jgi:hypothetical protein